MRKESTHLRISWTVFLYLFVYCYRNYGGAGGVLLRLAYVEISYDPSHLKSTRVAPEIIRFVSTGWDIIRMFELDSATIQGVRVVTGSDDVQRAYRLLKNHDISEPAR